MLRLMLQMLVVLGAELGSSFGEDIAITDQENLKIDFFFLRFFFFFGFFFLNLNLMTDAFNIFLSGNVWNFHDVWSFDTRIHM